MLPVGYVQVEYIQSSGSQYINTGYAFNQNYNNGRIVVDYIPTEISGAYYSLRVSGSYDGSRALIMYGATSDGRLGVGSGDYQIGYSFVAGTRYLVDLTAKNGSITGIINGTTISSSYSGLNRSSYNYLIFCNNENGSPGNYGKIKLYSLKLYDNDVLVRDFIPALRLSDGELGLYDLQNNQFYINNGSGNFTCGPIINFVESDIEKIIIDDNPLLYYPLIADAALQANFERTSSVRIKVNGQWKFGMPYVKVNGVWKPGIAYTKVNGTWKEGL